LRDLPTESSYVDRKQGGAVASFDVVLTTRASIHPDGEPSQFVSEYDGNVLCVDDRTGKPTTVGRVRAHKVHAGLASDDGESLFEVCDCHSGELHYLQTLLYKPHSYEFKGPLKRRYHAFEPDLLVLDWVVLHPKWRGLRLGLLVVRKVVDLLGNGCGLAVSEIAPLRHDAHRYLDVPRAWVPERSTAAERRRAGASLRRYFRGMGFRRLGRTPVYVFPMALKTPDAGELLGQRRPW